MANLIERRDFLNLGTREVLDYLCSSFISLSSFICENQIKVSQATFYLMTFAVVC